MSSSVARAKLKLKPKTNYMDMKWYLVYTKPGSEKKVSETLTRKKIENYSPVNSISGKWGDKKFKEAPLFKGYVFVKTTEHFHHELKKVSGVINLVYWMGKPVCIKNMEVKAIRLFLSEYSDVSLEKTTIKSDINSHGFLDTEQEAPMITIKNKKASITLASIGYVLSAAAESTSVRVISAGNILDRSSSKSKLFTKVSVFNNSLRNYWAKAFIISACFSAVLH
jgi:hypothetical protein